MAPTSLNPKKLKVVLTSLREAITSLANDRTSSTIGRAFRLLLVAELASRGVGVDLPKDGGDDFEWIVTLLESIGIIAGKVAIDDLNGSDGGGSGKGYPVPMMAALTAASGMAASACRDSFPPDGDAAITNAKCNTPPSLLPMEEKSVREAAFEAMERCREVNDGRFYALLKLAHDVDSETKGDESPSAEREGRRRQVNQLKKHFSTISYANYLYGAFTFAKDQPPMWKRCLDAALENTRLAVIYDNDSRTNGYNNGVGRGGEGSAIDYTSYRNSQTILPLKNMIRIAKSKANEKRAKELSLFLSVGYFGGVQERLSHIQKEASAASSSTVVADTKGKEGEEGKPHRLDELSLEQLLWSHFMRRSSALAEMEDFSTCLMLLESSKESLAACECPTEINSENCESWLLYHYVKFQTEHLAEESTIWIEVKRQHRAMLNRRPEGSVGSGGKGGGGGIGMGSKKLAAKTTALAAMEEMERQTRCQTYLDKWSAWKLGGLSETDPLSPSALRDAVVAARLALPSPPPAATHVLRDCYGSLIHQVERLVEIAAVVAHQQNKGMEEVNLYQDVRLVWETVLRFVSPLMEEYLHPLVATVGDDVASMDATLRRLAECCSEAIVSASWMLEPFTEQDAKEGYDFNNISRLLSMAHECLAACQKERLTKEERASEARKKETSVLSSKDGRSMAEKSEQLLFQCALAASKCRMEVLDSATKEGESGELSSEASVDALVAAGRNATIAATAASKFPSSSANATFGAPYLRFLSAWSGMYRSPWPFCALGQARAVLQNAREARSIAGKVWGRVTSSVVEQALLDVGEADLEGGLTGGFRDVSETLYRRAIDSLEKEGLPAVEGCVMGMIKVHCLLGLAGLSLSGGGSSDALAAEELTRSALHILSTLASNSHQDGSPVLCIYPWSVPSLGRLSHSYHVCAARQLVAEACLRSSRPEDARSFLMDAVKDSPGNYEAAFALASFNLRIMLANGRSNENEAKKTRTLLLKAAKMGMDAAGGMRPDPFALLGVWYESHNDTGRARGCFQKALAVDPSHPVAGRGLRRSMTNLEEERQLRTLCGSAAKRNSPSNGWAWRVLGWWNSRGEKGSDDAAASVCFQQALRRQDVQAPEKDALGTFYADPTMPPSSAPGVSTGGLHHETSETWAELAACYRRLGKYSAALRAYEAAYSVSDGNLSPDTLCAWAQVDLDLGLYEEAADKCDKVFCLEGSSEIHRMATYIEGEALLFLARRVIQECKFGSCLSYLEKGISRLSALSFEEKPSRNNYYCELKLLGDLYSSGNSLPSYVFDKVSPLPHTEHEREMGHLRFEVENQLLFMMKGEQAYTLALEIGKNEDKNEEDNKRLIAAALTDLGSNLLSQARVVSMALGEGSGGGTKTSLSDFAMQPSQIKGLITRSVNAYLSAVDTSPHEAPAWCGLGCALIALDPLLSQHAFSRALQIDASLADSWSHISLLYAKIDVEKCSEILDLLTQIEDTPLMWIGRGFLLEKTSREWKDQDFAREGCLTKAADAYRAALQITQHPAALLGLSLTCRRADLDLKKSNNLVYSSLADHASKSESRMTMAIHQNMTDEGNIGASFVSGLTQIEEGLNRLNACVGREGLDLFKETDAAMDRARICPENDEGSGSEMAQCQIDLSVSYSLRPDKTAEFLYDLIKDARNQASDIFSSQCIGKTGNIGTSCNGLNEARNNAYLNPESGEVWLIFARKLAQELTSDARDVAMLSSTKIAARRAYDLLLDRVVNVTLLSSRRQTSSGKSIEYSDKSVVSSLPSASLLSESMSLLSWLEEAEALDSEERFSVSKRTLASMQESLMLDPLNTIAAASLAHMA
eukprot:CAMPEP_0172534280 /NCGR_PEP_ID=MMETSP1067-20121228/6705_1 /TAXON_ID=265564 ORGANISM="Thalassiosira punctigera, Strain Tpunct2005C2" /NCGR_SAMPLE_ID=MMETSP1067 /ASSEMBLY_ACC=CAM_ASM_000444 /LENGTH=1832 /DNA_ID=CAMNT_0013319057 /DNA_START=41 /DNA_END=5539 /DNA_ORIENTATION=+